MPFIILPLNLIHCSKTINSSFILSTMQQIRKSELFFKFKNITTPSLVICTFREHVCTFLVVYSQLISVKLVQLFFKKIGHINQKIKLTRLIFGLWDCILKSCSHVKKKNYFLSVLSQISNTISLTFEIVLIFSYLNTVQMPETALPFKCGQCLLFYTYIDSNN